MFKVEKNESSSDLDFKLRRNDQEAMNLHPLSDLS